MIKKALERILRRRHFWRDAGFNELTELYISTMLRVFAVSVLMVFIPFYLYQEGFPLYMIFAFFGIIFSVRVITDVLASYFVARFGPKHSMIVACFAQIIASSLLLTLPEYHWPLWSIGMMIGISSSFYFIAYHVEFSKIKHIVHVGKELSNMQIFQKIAAIAGPLIGGVAGTLLGPRYIFIIASVILIASLWPLFRTAEPVKIHFRLDFHRLPFHRLKRDFTSYFGLSIENSLSLNIWSLYIALFALSGSVYAKLGAISSVSVIASIITAHVIGKFIDKKRSRRLLRISSVTTAGLHMLRPFVGSLWPAFLTNVTYEITSTGYRLPYLKGFYGRPDELKNLRTEYVTALEVFGNLSRASIWWILTILATSIGDKTVLIIGFAIAAAAALMIRSERFPALDSKS